MENLPEEIIFSALAQASDAAIFSEYARRMSARRNRKSGGVVWIKHQPNAKLGCRCAKVGRVVPAGVQLAVQLAAVEHDEPLATSRGSAEFGSGHAQSIV